VNPKKFLTIALVYIFALPAALGTHSVATAPRGKIEAPYLAGGGDISVSFNGNKVPCPSDQERARYLLQLNGYLATLNPKLTWGTRDGIIDITPSDFIYSFYYEAPKEGAAGRPRLYLTALLPTELESEIFSLSQSRSQPGFYLKGEDGKYIAQNISTVGTKEAFRKKVGDVPANLRNGDLHLFPGQSDLATKQYCHANMKVSYLYRNSDVEAPGPLPCLRGNRLWVGEIEYGAEEIAEALLPHLKRASLNAVEPLEESIRNNLTILDLCRLKKAAGPAPADVNNAQIREMQNERREKEEKEKPYWEAMIRELKKQGFEDADIRRAIEKGRAEFVLKPESALTTPKLEVAKAKRLSKKQLDDLQTGEPVALLIKENGKFVIAVSKVQEVADDLAGGRLVNFKEYYPRAARIIAEANGLGHYSGPWIGLGISRKDDDSGTAIYGVFPLKVLPLK